MLKINYITDCLKRNIFINKPVKNNKHYRIIKYFLQYTAYDIKIINTPSNNRHQNMMGVLELFNQNQLIKPNKQFSSPNSRMSMRVIDTSFKSLDMTDNELNVLFQDSPCEHYEQQPYWEPKVENLIECDFHGQDNQCSSCSLYFDHSYQTIPTRQQQDLSSSEDHYCNCQKTGCIKLYCSCFRRGVECNEQCICCECHNHPGDTVLDEAKDRIVTLYHQEPGFDNFHGCNCKKSKCKQNYCECLIRGRKCGDECRCKKCENGKIYVKIIRKRNKAKLSTVEIKQQS